MKSTLITTAFFALAAHSVSAAQATSEIYVLGQDGNALEILVDHNGNDLATLRITDGGEIEQVRIPAGREQRHSYLVPAQGSPLQLRNITLELVDSKTGDLLDSELASVIDPLMLPADEPTLTLSTNELLVLRKNWKLDSRTGRALDLLKLRNDRRLGNRLLVPKTGGEWSQLYRCPDTQVRLEMIDFHTHRSPITGKEFSGSPYDEAVTTYRHKAVGVQAFEMALMYQLTKNLAYAERAEEILLTYARLYPSFELHDRFGSARKDAGRAFSQSLEEAQWLIDLVRARDLLRGSGLIDEYEDHALKTQLFDPAIAVIERNNIGIYNIQCWHNTALFLAGIQAGNLQAAHEASFGPTGMAAQLTQGIRSDGIWYEGSLGYHFFAVRGMLPMVHAASRAGVQIDYSPMQTMFTSAWNLMQPDFSLPSLNDGASEDYERTLRDEYEQALALFPDEPRLNDPLAVFGRGNSLSAVLWGPREIRNEGWSDVASAHYDSTGLAALRSGPVDRRTMALVDYGDHGGYHGHYDKLGLTLWMQGSLAIREAGADGYGQAISEEFFRSTLAHSTVVVDGQNQAEACGSSAYFDTEAGSTISAKVEDAYPGVTLRRLVHVTEEGHAADMFAATGSTQHTFDYVLHGNGTATTNLNLVEGSTGFGGAYGYLSNVMTATTDGDIEVSFSSEGVTSRIKVLGEPGTTVFLAEAPGAPIGTTHPILIVRRSGDHATFAAGITEGAPSAGFQVDLDNQGWEPKLEVQRPGAADLRRLSFDSQPGI
jgi:oligo-alginate lyase